MYDVTGLREEMSPYLGQRTTRVERYYDEYNGLVAKRCSKCYIIKPVEEYYFAQLTKDNITAHCKQCIKEKNK